MVSDIPEKLFQLLKKKSGTFFFVEFFQKSEKLVWIFRLLIFFSAAEKLFQRWKSFSELAEFFRNETHKKPQISPVLLVALH